mmetsp:Transcript_40853/g.123089  ORF Transcript_40853/g.123089 Transcript_40853/m.123089 type:complete len:237 (-) Transcript_40853:4136-4846(-)
MRHQRRRRPRRARWISTAWTTATITTTATTRAGSPRRPSARSRSANGNGRNRGPGRPSRSNRRGALDSSRFCPLPAIIIIAATAIWSVEGPLDRFDSLCHRPWLGRPLRPRGRGLPPPSPLRAGPSRRKRKNGAREGRVLPMSSRVANPNPTVLTPVLPPMLLLPPTPTGWSTVVNPSSPSDQCRQWGPAASAEEGVVVAVPATPPPRTVWQLRCPPVPVALWPRRPSGTARTAAG